MLWNFSECSLIFWTILEYFGILSGSVGLKVFSVLFTLYLSNLNPEDEVSSLKSDGLMTIYISKLKWAWQAQFLSHILVILKNSVFFEDKQMILL